MDKVVGVGSDIWALGCTLFEIRTGRKLFDTFDDDQDEYLCKMAMMLGKLPEPWWSTTWEARKLFFEDNVDGDGRVVEIRRELLQPDSGDGEVRLRPLSCKFQSRDRSRIQLYQAYSMRIDMVQEVFAMIFLRRKLTCSRIFS